MLRIFFWELRNGHWNAATKLIAIIAFIIPILNYFLKKYFKLPDSILDLFIPTICLLVLIFAFFLHLIASKKQSKNRLVNYASEISKLVKQLNSQEKFKHIIQTVNTCLLYTSPSPRDQRGSRMPSSA